jgi:hypothetical protein
MHDHAQRRTASVRNAGCREPRQYQAGAIRPGMTRVERPRSGADGDYSLVTVTRWRLY